jgi:hypothetical protein
MPFKYKEPIDRVIANSVPCDRCSYKGTPCWEWIGKRKMNRSGMFYGVITERSKRTGKVLSVLVHRWVLCRVLGRRLTPLMVGRHLCNNTLCCNPDHLAGGTQKTNMRDKKRCE